MHEARQIIGCGPDGIEYTLSLLTQWKNYYGSLSTTRRVALLIAGSVDDHVPEAQAAALASFVKESLVYQADPVNSELIQTPDVLLVTISESPTGTAAGDCDDHVLLFCALAESLGIACDVAGVAAPGADRINHVIAVVHLPDRDVDLDLVAKHGPQPVYAEKLIVGA